MSGDASEYGYGMRERAKMRVVFFSFIVPH
jgi:hypothetical protein